MLLSEIVGYVSEMLKITLESTLAFGVTLRVPHGHLWGPSGTLQTLKQYQEILYIRVVLYASVMMKKITLFTVSS